MQVRLYRCDDIVSVAASVPFLTEISPFGNTQKVLIKERNSKKRKEEWFI